MSKQNQHQFAEPTPDDYHAIADGMRRVARTVRAFGVKSRAARIEVNAIATQGRHDGTGGVLCRAVVWHRQQLAMTPERAKLEQALELLMRGVYKDQPIDADSLSAMADEIEAMGGSRKSCAPNRAPGSRPGNMAFTRCLKHDRYRELAEKLNDVGPGKHAQTAREYFKERGSKSVTKDANARLQMMRKYENGGRKKRAPKRAPRQR